MSEPEEQKKFKVTDRRSFTEAGDRRLDTEAEAEPESLESTHPAEPSVAPPQPEPPQRPAPTATESRDGVQFLDLVGMLATQASLSLGEPNPVTGQSRLDLPGARALIAMVEILQEKTAGNLTAEEATALEEILYALRSRFVAKAKAAKP